MCLVSKPSIPQSSTDPNKPLPILRNPMLDGMLGNIAAMRNGVSALRIPLNPLGIPVGIGSGANASGGGGSGSSSGSSGSGSSGGGGSFSSGGGGTRVGGISGTSGAIN